MSTNTEQRLQQQIDELMLRLAAEREARQRAEADICELSICAIGAVNPSVREYMQHWEQRAEAAEARIKASQEQEPVAAVELITGDFVWLTAKGQICRLLHQSSRPKWKS